MERARWQLQKLPVEFCKFDFDDCESSAKPHAPATPGTAHLTSRVQMFDEMLQAVIKTECKGEDAMVTEELLVGYLPIKEEPVTTHDVPVREVTCFVVGPNVVTKCDHENGGIVKTEDGMVDVIVKEEIYVGPTVLQRAAQISEMAIRPKDITRRPRGRPLGKRRPLERVTELRRRKARRTHKQAQIVLQEDAEAQSDSRPDRLTAQHLQALNATRSAGCGAPAPPDAVAARLATRIKEESKHCRIKRPALANSTRDSVVEEVDKPNSSTLKVESVNERRCGAEPEPEPATRETRTHAYASYQCDSCEYTTKVKSNLIQHIRTHSDDKPFVCGLCDYSASSGAYLREHSRIHMRNKVYKCDQCAYTATRRHYLSAHLRYHTTYRPYKCDQCWYSASRPHNLKVHMRVHAGDTSHKCVQCEYNASRKRHLIKHMRSHTAGKLYRCDHCEFFTFYLGCLKRHMHSHLQKEQCAHGDSQRGGHVLPTHQLGTRTPLRTYGRKSRSDASGVTTTCAPRQSD